MIPQRWKPFTQLVLARIREFYREPEVLFWVYGFPLLLAVGLGIAFAGREVERPDVDVQEGDGAEEIKTILESEKFTVEIHSPEDCKDRLKKGKTVLYIVPPLSDVEYHFDPTRVDREPIVARYWAEAAMLRTKVGSAVRSDDKFMTEPGSRYIDFLLPGILGMNIMGGGLFGVGFVLVDMRVRKLFKRLLATPMRHSDFMLAMLASRLLFLVPEMLVIFFAGRWWFGVPMYGSVLTLVVVILVGAAAFAGLGLLLACRTEKTEAISAYLNLVMLPSYLLSGVFFPSKRFPDMVQPFIQALPLTQLNDALRAVMLEGAGFADVGWRIAILACWAVVCFALALRWFRWR
jgi:ABC transporter DrrB family efflux protein